MLFNHPEIFSILNVSISSFLIMFQTIFTHSWSGVFLVTCKLLSNDLYYTMVFNTNRLLTKLSKIIVVNITKNKTHQNCGTGIWLSIEGKATKARPGPENNKGKPLMLTSAGLLNATFSLNCYFYAYLTATYWRP